MRRHPEDIVCVESLELRRMLAVLPTGFTDQLVAGVSNATSFTFAPDGRLFITEQGGALRVVDHGVLQSSPFTTVSTSANGERGLLGVAFDPNYSRNHYVYVYYTASTPAVHNRVSRFTASAANENVAQAGSETVLLDLNNLSGATNHNGGAIHFGPDGKLYIAVGENANGANAQSFGNLLGKMLRVNADGTIPTDNPYFTDAAVTGQNKLIWALGLRNPFTFAFQRGTGRMFINDVGQDTWEEVNDGIARSNYGWPGIEGKRTTQTPPADYRDPYYVYSNVGSQIAIIGGAFYNPTYPAYPSTYEGKYFFADLGAGWIRTLDTSLAAPAAVDFGTGGSTIVGFELGPDNSVYFLQRSGTVGVHRMAYTDTAAPSVTSAAFVYNEAAVPFETAQRVRVKFSEFVGNSLTAGDFTVENLTTSTTIPTANLHLSYDSLTNTATLSFPGYANAAGALPNGRYRLTLAANAASDITGNNLIAGRTLEFNVLAGDLNGDNTVNFDDLLTLAQNYQTSGTYSQGDLNYDGTIDFSDLLILAQNYQSSIVAGARSTPASQRNRIASDVIN